MTRPDPDVRRLASAPGRSAAEIEAKLDLRARLAVEHLARLAAEGPERDCCLCGYRGRFSPVRAKPGIWCPSCDSRPRHRLFKLWLDRGGAAEIEGRRVLHFASEPVLTAVVQPLAGAYATADILPGHDLHLDMEAIDQPDGSWDVAIANHVLEHLDDRRALVGAWDTRGHAFDLADGEHVLMILVDREKRSANRLRVEWGTGDGVTGRVRSGPGLIPR